jgi:Sigma-70 region 2
MHPVKNWDRLMAAAQAGDARAYRTLLSELAPWLRRYYARRLPPAMTEDAVQDVLLAIHEKRHTYDPERPFGPWIAVGGAGCIDTAWCPNGSCGNRSCRWCLVGCPGRVCLRFRLPVGRSALHRGLVHGRLLHRDHTGAGHSNPAVAMVIVPPPQ